MDEWMDQQTASLWEEIPAIFYDWITAVDRGTELQRVYVILYTNSEHRYMKVAFEEFSNDKQDELLWKWEM